MNYLYTALISYLFGSFNTAYFIAKAKGFDIRERGSMNAGASNIKVNLGWGYAIFTCLCDFLKTILAMKLTSYLFLGDEIIPFLAGAMSIVGHIYPFYLGFHGGKGFACYIGMLLGLNWKFALIVMAIVAIITYVTNYIVVGTLTAITIVPLYYIYNKASIGVIAILVAIAALIAYKHRVNIKRILNGTEITAIERKKKVRE
ncbi:MAG: glycerol-3-phosphate acyltransferase [Erysipelotrichaceae bacterium]|nr:glycerol-3-phosphate acyltransferase [Erysipelotrichaceae bacterium]